jgi:hypothetical protein
VVVETSPPRAGQFLRGHKTPEPKLAAAATPAARAERDAIAAARDAAAAAARDASDALRTARRRVDIVAMAGCFGCCRFEDKKRD